MFKKISFFTLAILLLLGITGVANAANIPMGADPANQSEIWTVSVYNNASTNLTSGAVVVWDIDASATPATYTDRLMYVNTTTTQDDIWVAGVVVSPSIAASGGIGTIAIWGPVYTLCSDSSAAVTVGQLVSAYSTVQECGDFGGGGADEAILGVALSSDPNTVANGGYGGAGGKNFVMIPVFVDPSRYSDD